MNNKKTPSTIEMLKSIKEAGKLEVRNLRSNHDLIEKGNKLCRKGWLYFRCYYNGCGITHYCYTLTDKGRKFIDNSLLPETPVLTTLFASIEVSKEQIREVIEEALNKGKELAEIQYNDDNFFHGCYWFKGCIKGSDGTCNPCKIHKDNLKKKQEPKKEHLTDLKGESLPEKMLSHSGIKPLSAEHVNAVKMDDPNSRCSVKSEPRSENLFSGCLHFGECKRGHNGTCIGCSIYTKHLQTKDIAAMPQANHYTNGTDFGKIVCFDLDGVILKFDGWKGENVFGEVIKGARSTINWLKDNGWYVIIFTTRLVTDELVIFLADHGIPYDDINGRKIGNHVERQSYDTSITDYTGHMVSLSHYWKHNPAKASIKPIATVYVDDCDWRQEGKNFDKETWALFLNKIQKRFHGCQS